MRKRIAVLAMMLLTLGLLGGGVATATADDGSEETDKKELTLYAEEDAFTLVTATGEVFGEDDEEADQLLPSPGDRILVRDQLFEDPERSDNVGVNLIECTVITAEGETEQDFAGELLCHGVVSLTDEGDLSWQGRFAIPDAFVEGELIVAVTGGTGEFTDVGGQATIVFEEETQATYEIELLRFK